MEASAQTAAASPTRAGPGAATLYVIPGSHACKTGMLLLEHKGIPYRTVELITGLHPQLVRLHGFRGTREPLRTVDGKPTRMSAMMDRFGTVPAVAIGGERVQRNREIARYLDELVPDPPLFPPDPELRQRVEEAERFGDEHLQMAARRIVMVAGARNPDELAGRGAGGRLGALLSSSDAYRRVMSTVAARAVFKAGGDAEGRVMAELPPMLDRVDGWVADGTLNGDELNVADLVIAPSLALLDYRLDLREELRARPSFALLERVLPEPAAG
jgi:glutathione S-transferase